MNASRREIARAIYEAGRAHDAGEPDRLRRFRNVEPPTAELLAILILAGRLERVLEIGTSNGYSTIWLADAVEATGGRVVSVELEPARTEQARENLARAGLAARVELRTEDAAQTLARSADGAWQLIFLDAERPAYASYLPDLVRSLGAGGVLAVDNVISHAHELIDFTAAIEADERLTQTVVPVGAGLRLAVRRAGAGA
ncbi:MAG TPA: class I SAM-dependent methyltransferase [Solirubrobacteraceae bacterium]|nr:class I SAM-dependent methyltransferase [Solirubrobacteraceae bacterium]